MVKLNLDVNINWIDKKSLTNYETLKCDVNHGNSFFIDRYDRNCSIGIVNLAITTVDVFAKNRYEWINHKNYGSKWQV